MALTHSLSLAHSHSRREREEEEEEEHNFGGTWFNGKNPCLALSHLASFRLAVAVLSRVCLLARDAEESGVAQSASRCVLFPRQQGLRFRFG